MGLIGMGLHALTMDMGKAIRGFVGGLTCIACQVLPFGLYIYIYDEAIL